MGPAHNSGPHLPGRYLDVDDLPLRGEEAPQLVLGHRRVQTPDEHRRVGMVPVRVPRRRAVRAELRAGADGAAETGRGAREAPGEAAAAASRRVSVPLGRSPPAEPSEVGSGVKGGGLAGFLGVAKEVRIAREPQNWPFISASALSLSASLPKRTKPKPLERPEAGSNTTFAVRNCRGGAKSGKAGQRGGVRRDGERLSSESAIVACQDQLLRSRGWQREAMDARRRVFWSERVQQHSVRYLVSQIADKK